MNITLPTVVPSNSYNLYNVDHSVYLDYNLTILFTSGTTGPTKEALTNVTVVNKTFVID
jgi:hypothetical protein